MRWFTLPAAVLLLSAVAPSAWGVSYYTVTDLGTLGGSASAGLGINSSGQVVGCSYNSNAARRAFLFSNNKITDLGTLNGSSTIARDINDNGQITGSSYVNNAYRAMVVDNGVMTNLGTLPGDFDSYGRAINNSGQVAGVSRDFSYNAHAFLYSNGTMTNLGTLPGFSQSAAGAINQSGQVAGQSFNFLDGGHAFLYGNGAMTDLGTLGGTASYARGINDGGVVVGAADNAANLLHAFSYNNGTMNDLGTLGGRTSYAKDVNNSGLVVGSSETAKRGVYHGFVDANGTMIDLQSRIDPLSGWNLQSPTAINDSGSIVGMGTNPSGQAHGFLMTPITRPYAQLSLPSAYTDLRMMLGSTTAAGKTGIGIDAPGNTPTDYTLSATGLVLTSAGGTVAPAVVTAVPSTFRWTDTAATGSRTGSIGLANSDPNDLGNHTMNVTGAVLANRVLNVAPIGSALAPVRIMAKARITTTVNSGSDPLVDGDDAATRVNTVANAQVKDSVATVSYVAGQLGSPLRSTFDGANQSANLAVTFAKTGSYRGSITLAPVAVVTGSKGILKSKSAGNGGTSNGFFSDGEASSVGAKVQSASLSYAVNVLEARKLKATVGNLKLGNVLRGASVSTSFALTSTNQLPDSSHTTMVRVAPGGTPLGALTVGQTTISAGGLVNVPLTGTLNAYGSVSVKSALPVATAEDPSVQDFTSYRSIAVGYQANVGIAKFGRTPTSFGAGETVLSAAAAAHSQLANLSSKVNPTKTLAANATLASSVTGSGSLPGLYGAVGSEAEIVESTVLAANTTVTMQWRKRLPGEAHDPKAPLTATLPADAWLTSDVVHMGGLAADTTYALQMSFDNRINLALDGPTGGTVANEFPNLFLSEFDNSMNRWVNAATLGAIGPQAHQAVFESLTDFRAAYATTPLDQLQGSWGVDPATSPTGIGQAWAIVSGVGSGTFAVDPGVSLTSGFATVPEPSALALLISAVVIPLACGVRRWARKRNRQGA